MNIMINFNEFASENSQKQNPCWPHIPDRQYRVLIGSGESGKMNVLLNLINQQSGIGKIYLYVKDPYESKYQFLIIKHEDVGMKHWNDPKVFIKYSSYIKDVYKSIQEYNPGNKRKVLIVFDDFITEVITNTKRQPAVTELFIEARN